MGCFNLTGFHTNLPITEGDDVFILLCIYNPAVSKLNTFAPGNIFTPIVLPIFGTYNEYGGIDNIIYDENVKHIENITCCDIETLINDILDVYYNTYNANDNIVNSIIDYIKPSTCDCKLIYIMDHKCFYDSCVAMYNIHKYTLNNWYTDTIKFKEEINNKLQTYQNLYEKTKSKELKNLIDSGYLISYTSNIHSLSPNYKCGFYFGYRENRINNRLFLSLYKDEYDVVLLNNCKEQYFDFLCFIEAFIENSWIIELHNNASQDYDWKTHLAIYEDLVTFIKSKISN